MRFFEPFGFKSSEMAGRDEMTTRKSKPRAVSKESKVKLEFWEHVLIELQLLSQSENAYILQNLQNRQLAQATAVVQEDFQMIPKISK